MTTTEPTPTTLYRFFDAANRLLYVGIAGNPGRRFSEHGKDKGWWTNVARSTMEHFATRDAALTAERAAIIDEKPVHNVVHNRGHRTPTPEPRCQWACFGCGVHIVDGSGYLEIEGRSAPLGSGQAPTSIAEQIQSMRVNAGAATLELFQADLTKADPERRWSCWHRACDPDPTGTHYWIAVERVRTQPQLREWTRHLNEKRWIAGTNWWAVDLLQSGGLGYSADLLAQMTAL